MAGLKVVDLEVDHLVAGLAVAPLMVDLAVD